MNSQIKIRDLTLRDGQQSQFATRMTQDQVDRILPYYKNARFYAMEVWGGAVPDSIMRFLGENPWTRLEKIKAEIGDTSQLTALSRGRNLFGYNPYPDKVIDGFCHYSIESGIDIMRIFDALNDIENMKSTIRFVHQYKGLADCAVCYTVDPKITRLHQIKSLLSGRYIPKKIFTLDYFVQKARQLAEIGADIITIKDMAGLIDPRSAAELIRKLKDTVSVPINLHTHCTPGYGLGSVLMAMVSGVDIVDTVLWNFAGGPAAPAFELVQILADKLGISTDVNIEATRRINQELLTIRQELSAFDNLKQIPRPFELGIDPLPGEAEVLFDAAIAAARRDDFDTVTRETQKIEAFFHFPPPDELVRKAQLPGGMYSNMISQLNALKLDHLFQRALELVPQVRLDAGCPPLVTPTSQIVGVQAVNCVIDENKKVPHYTNTSVQFVNLVKGSYGKTPLPIAPSFRQKISGSPNEIPYDTSGHQPQKNPTLANLGSVKLAQTPREELLMELFPNVAQPFLSKIREAEFASIEKERLKNSAKPDLWDVLADWA